MLPRNCIIHLCVPAADVDSLLKKSESQHESPEDGCPFGPLTQRLLQALVEVSISETKYTHTQRHTHKHTHTHMVGPAVALRAKAQMSPFHELACTHTVLNLVTSCNHCNFADFPAYLESCKGTKSSRSWIYQL